MPKKRTIKSVKTSCDKLVSQIIRSLGHCERCGKTDGLQAAHFITRSNHTLRWDLDNLICLCAGCHLFWAHKEIQEFVEWFAHRYPTRYTRLMREKNELTQRTLVDYEELEAELKHILEHEKNL